MNYRVITISLLDGSLFDIADFTNLEDALAWMRTSRFFVGPLHTFCVNMSNPMGRSVVAWLDSGTKRQLAEVV